jgi:hypothetical protein
MTEERRFTLDGGQALENRLADTCRLVLRRVRALVSPSDLEALLLAGGYGRGEGGVLRTAGGEAPYNDLEFYLLLRGNCRLNERGYGRALHAIAEELRPAAGVELEFKILSLAKLERSPPNMFYYDLLVGHRCLWGDTDLLARCAHHCAPEKIPPSEATRLLMNRCSGLLFSLVKLTASTFTRECADFVARNHAKAQLAFGDAILAAVGQYHWSCRERHGRLERLTAREDCPLTAKALPHHACGVAFKLHPSRSLAPREELLLAQARLMAFALELWLWLESRRLEKSFPSPWDYVSNPVNKCNETAPSRNLLLNLAVFGREALGTGKLFHYPRERLLETLPLLLWESEALRQPERLRFVQNRLRTEARDFPDLVQAYAGLWSRFH